MGGLCRTASGSIYLKPSSLGHSRLTLLATTADPAAGQGPLSPCPAPQHVAQDTQRRSPGVGTCRGGRPSGPTLQASPLHDVFTHNQGVGREGRVTLTASQAPLQGVCELLLIRLLFLLLDPGIGDCAAPGKTVSQCHTGMDPRHTALPATTRLLACDQA